MTLRLFVAIPLSNSLKVTLYEYQKSLSLDAKFVERENLHITVSFLGSQEESGLQTIIDALTNGTMSVAPFTIQFGSIKTIPPQNPRLIAAWYKDHPAYQTLVAIVTQFAEKTHSREQLPHITLARIRKSTQRSAIVMPDQTFPDIVVSEIHLVSSTLSPQGPRYNTLARFLLSG